MKRCIDCKWDKVKHPPRCYEETKELGIVCCNYFRKWWKFWREK